MTNEIILLELRKMLELPNVYTSLPKDGTNILYMTINSDIIEGYIHVIIDDSLRLSLRVIESDQGEKAITSKIVTDIADASDPEFFKKAFKEILKALYELMSKEKESISEEIEEISLRFKRCQETLTAMISLRLERCQKTLAAIKNEEKK